MWSEGQKQHLVYRKKLVTNSSPKPVDFEVFWGREKSEKQSRQRALG